MADPSNPPTTSDTAARLDRIRKDRPEMLSDRLGYDTSVGDDDWERIATTSDDDRRRIIAQVRGTVDAWRDRSLTSFRAMVAIEKILGGAQ